MTGWMSKAAESMEKRGTKGALHRDLGIAADKPIPTSTLRSQAARLHEKAEAGKLTQSERLRSRRINFALRARHD